MKIGFVQNNPEFGRIDINLARVAAMLVGHSYDLMVLPELFATGYVYENRQEVVSLAEEPGRGPVTCFLGEQARLKHAVLVGGFAEKDGERIYNSACLAAPDGTVRVYRKLHLFDREKELFDRASEPFWVQSTDAGRIGPMICFDWYFPESARTLAILGAEIIAHPSNLVLPHCPEAMKTRALENRVFTITANRIGTETRAGLTLSFIGQSRIYAPTGEMIAGAGQGNEEVHVVSVDLSLAGRKKVTPTTDLFLDRRPEFYRLG